MCNYCTSFDKVIPVYISLLEAVNFHLNEYVEIGSLTSWRDLPSGYCYFQVIGEYVTPESSIHLLKVTPTVRGLACSLHLAETLNYDHHT